MLADWVVREGESGSRVRLAVPTMASIEEDREIPVISESDSLRYSEKVELVMSFFFSLGFTMGWLGVLLLWLCDADVVGIGILVFDAGLGWLRFFWPLPRPLLIFLVLRTSLY